MTDIQQGLIVEDFEPLYREDMSVILFALEQLRSREENERIKRSSRDGYGKMLPETEMSARALRAYDKLLRFEDHVKMHIGIRDFILVPVTKALIHRLDVALGRKF